LSNLAVTPLKRKEVLGQRQRLKMAESAHVYVRGNAIRFYDWLKGKSVQASMPAGQSIQQLRWFGTF
jgi:uncharacterized protein (DUF2252 family)